jgi:hypothetical protein
MNIERKLRVLIPNNLIFLTAKWYPKMKITAIEGAGSIMASSQKYPFELGTIEPRMMNQAHIDWKANGINNAKTMQEISDILLRNKIINGTISKLEYTVDLGKSFDCDHAELAFEKYTPHKTIDLRRVVNGGSFPDQQLYQILKDVLGELPPNLKKNYKSSVLRIVETKPHKQWIDDEAFIRAIKEERMIPYQLVNNQWVLQNQDFRQTGKVKVN